MLTLTTCHPRGSDTQRLVARAKLIETKEIA
jgi:sortase (surface protein transpeptidase)